MNVYVSKILTLFLVAVSVGVMLTLFSVNYQTLEYGDFTMCVYFGFPSAWLMGHDCTVCTFDTQMRFSILWRGFVSDVLVYSTIAFSALIICFAGIKLVGMKIGMDEWLSRRGLRRILAVLILIPVLAVCLLIAIPAEEPKNWHIYQSVFVDGHPFFKVAIVLSLSTVGLVGLVYLLTSLVLAHMKKRRHTHRSKI